MCVCVCVCVSEISEFAQNKNDNNSSEFLFIKKEEKKKSYVLSGEISFFFTACILYEYIWLLKLVQNWEK